MEGCKRIASGANRIEPDVLGPLLRQVRRSNAHCRPGLEVEVVTAHVRTSLDDVVIGGGNAKKLKLPPLGCRLGSNTKAFLGGFRMWEPWASRNPQTRGLVMTRQRKRNKQLL